MLAHFNTSLVKIRKDQQYAHRYMRCQETARDEDLPLSQPGVDTWRVSGRIPTKETTKQKAKRRRISNAAKESGLLESHGRVQRDTRKRWACRKAKCLVVDDDNNRSSTRLSVKGAIKAKYDLVHFE